jgi:RNA polymerase sigma factor (sigma-70 family)
VLHVKRVFTFDEFTDDKWSEESECDRFWETTLIHSELWTDNDEEKSTAQVRMLHERIARLQPLDRAIVLLWLEQISYDEIGDIVGLSAKNVSVRLARIRVQLKNMSNE